MNPTLILWPMIIHALVTLFLYLPMSRTRVRTVKEGKVKATAYKLNEDEPAESKVFSNAIRNQNEIGVLFYAACLTAYVTTAPMSFAVVFAWIFIIAKCVHVYVHVTSNRLRFRRPIFMIAYLMVILLWLLIAVHLAGVI
jgi:hypothetical protein